MMKYTYQSKDIFDAIQVNSVAQVKEFLDSKQYTLKSKQEEYFFNDETGDKVKRRKRLTPLQLARLLKRDKIVALLKEYK